MSLPLGLPADVPASAPATAPAVAPGAGASRGEPDTCANCRAPSDGQFCARCGTPSLERRPVTVRRFAGDIWNEVANADSTTLRTLRTLVQRPGELTVAFLDGRTRWFLSPVRVFLLTFAICLFVRSLTSIPDQATAELRRASVSATATPTNTALDARQARTRVAAEDIRAMQQSAFQAAMTNQWLRLMDPLLVGLALAALFWGRRRSYAEHVLFALHLMAFNWLLSMVTTVLRAMTGVGLARSIDWILLLHWAVFGTYAYLAARRVHAQPPGRTAVKAIAIVAAGQVTMIVVPTIVSLGAGLWLGAHAAWQLHR